MPRSAYAAILTLLLGYLLLSPRPATAQTRPFLDIVLLFDHSYSMFEHQDGRLGEAKSAAIHFVDHLNPRYDRVGLVRFSEGVEVQKPLGAPFADIKNKIQSYHLDSFSAYTNLQNAIAGGLMELTGSSTRRGAKKFIILLSDGGINRPLFNGTHDIPRAHSAAFDAAAGGRDAGVTIHVVIIGTDPGDQQILKEIAGATGGKSYLASSPADLIPIYGEIAENVIHESFPASDIAEKESLRTAASPRDSSTVARDRNTADVLKARRAEKESEPVVPPVSIMREEIRDGELPPKPSRDDRISPFVIVLAAALFCTLFGGAMGFAVSRYFTPAKR